MKKNIINTIITSSFIFAGIAALLITQAHAQESQNGLVSSPDLASSDSTILAAKFLKQIEIVSRVKIDGEVLKGAAFRSLVDYTQPIPTELRGRPNPFAPF